MRIKTKIYVVFLALSILMWLLVSVTAAASSSTTSRDDLSAKIEKSGNKYIISLISNSKKLTFRVSDLSPQVDTSKYKKCYVYDSKREEKPVHSGVPECPPDDPLTFRKNEATGGQKAGKVLLSILTGASRYHPIDFRSSYFDADEYKKAVDESLQTLGASKDEVLSEYSTLMRSLADERMADGSEYVRYRKEDIRLVPSIRDNSGFYNNDVDLLSFVSIRENAIPELPKIEFDPSRQPFRTVFADTKKSYEELLKGATKNYKVQFKETHRIKNYFVRIDAPQEITYSPGVVREVPITFIIESKDFSEMFPGAIFEDNVLKIRLNKVAAPTYDTKQATIDAGKTIEKLNAEIEKLKWELEKQSGVLSAAARSAKEEDIKAKENEKERLQLTASDIEFNLDILNKSVYYIDVKSISFYVNDSVLSSSSFDQNFPPQTNRTNLTLKVRKASNPKEAEIFEKAIDAIKVNLTRETAEQKSVTLGIAARYESEGKTQTLYESSSNKYVSLLAEKPKEMLQKAKQPANELAVEKSNVFSSPIGLKGEPLFSAPMAKRIDGLRPSVVIVRSEGGHGSGFFVTSDGYLLTSRHVVGYSKAVKIILESGREITAEVIRIDSKMDVALLKTREENLTVKALPIVAKEQEVGDEVYAIGTPRFEALQGTVTKGIISSYRTLDGLKYIQSDVNIQPGSSGGPLLDNRGNVIGITKMGLASREVMEGLNFFVPIHDALSALNIKLEIMSKQPSAVKKRKPH